MKGHNNHDLDPICPSNQNTEMTLISYSSSINYRFNSIYRLNSTGQKSWTLHISTWLDVAFRAEECGESIASQL